MTGEIFFIDYNTSWSEKNFKFLKSLFPFVWKIDYTKDIYSIFKTAAEKSTTDQFWIIDGSIRPLPNFTFNCDISKWDTRFIHSYNVLVNWKLVSGGIYVATKNFSYEFKQLKTLAGFDKSKSYDYIEDNFDIVFISYNEADADKNYEKLKLQLGRDILRVHGVKGIHNAHKEAALLAKTSMFWVVDADADILPKFKFDYKPARWDVDTVHVWKSINPLNNLDYGFGGVKLLPRQSVLDMDLTSVDMTTSITKKFKAMPVSSNYTIFNTDEFSTWRSAFRECVKLSSSAIDNNQINIDRLLTWCTVAEGNYAKECIAGANLGRKYGEENKGNKDALAKINDFEWLQARWQEEKSLI